MAYTHEAPYVDPYRYNSDWELHTVKETRERMDALEKKEEEFENDINQQWEQFQSNIAADFKKYQDDTNALIQQWENQTITNLDAWKQETYNTLQSQYATFTNNVNSEIQRFESDITTKYNNLLNEFNDLSGEFASIREEYHSLETTMQQYRDSINTTVQNFTTQIQTDMTTFQNGVNTTLESFRQEQAIFEQRVNGAVDAQNGKLTEMQTQINGFSGQVPGLVNDYLNTLTPGYNALSAEVARLTKVQGGQYRASFSRRNVVWVSCDPSVANRSAIDLYLRNKIGITDAILNFHYYPFPLNRGVLELYQSMIALANQSPEQTVFVVSLGILVSMAETGQWAILDNGSAQLAKQMARELMEVCARKNIEIYTNIRAIADKTPNNPVAFQFAVQQHCNLLSRFYSSAIRRPTANMITGPTLMTQPVSPVAYAAYGGANVIFFPDCYSVSFYLNADSYSNGIQWLYTGTKIATAASIDSNGRASMVTISPSNSAGLEFNGTGFSGAVAGPLYLSQVTLSYL